MTQALSKKFIYVALNFDLQKLIRPRKSYVMPVLYTLVNAYSVGVEKHVHKRHHRISTETLAFDLQNVRCIGMHLHCCKLTLLQHLALVTCNESHSPANIWTHCISSFSPAINAYHQHRSIAYMYKGRYNVAWIVYFVIKPGSTGSTHSTILLPDCSICDCWCLLASGNQYQL